MMLRAWINSAKKDFLDHLKTLQGDLKSTRTLNLTHREYQQKHGFSSVEKSSFHEF